MYCISFKNAFTILCSFLTLALIFQVMFTYVVKKPTTTSKEEKKLEITDIPEVVVCLDPGLDYESLTSWLPRNHLLERRIEFKWKVHWLEWKGGGEQIVP